MVIGQLRERNVALKEADATWGYASRDTKERLHRRLSSSKLTKISKQHENTWAQLHRRLISLPFSYKDIFAENVYDYIDNQAVSRYMLQISVRINFNQLKLISTRQI